MKGFFVDIENETLDNLNYRKVLYTGKNSQLVLMSIMPNEQIGEETHEDVDQFFRIESGMGKAIIDGNEYDLSDGSAVIVPAGATHNIMNISNDENLQLYTIYSPPEHLDQISFETKEEADSSRAKDKVNGYGLGLSLAKQITDLHNGEIFVKSAVGKGTQFSIKLPSAK